MLVTSFNRAGAGRPRDTTTVEEILELRQLNFKWTKIAEMLNISRSTLYRRLREAGIEVRDKLVTDQQLDATIQHIKQNHPNDGEVLIQGHLVRQGIQVPRRMLRASIHRVDHDNVVARQHSVVKRRVYSVPHPNYLWHMDSHHKLIKWRFVIHGAVDGFSRAIMYMKCADNNRAQTVLDYFREGVSKFGLPEFVRSDKGGENVGVWRYMIVTHSNDQSRVITGSSVHNERIERMWRDVHRCIASTYAETFRELESDNMLDPLNEADLYCAHYIFIPRINQALEEFQESWNNHALSTEGSRTPYQLLMEGLDHVTTTYNYPVGALDGGLDIDLSELTSDHIQVPRLLFTPCSTLQQQLVHINPLQSTTDVKDLYRRAVETVGQHLLSNCSQCSF